MKYVLDSSVGFKWAVVEHLTDKARALRDEYTARNVDLIAPDIFPGEVTHALTRAERQGRITATQGGLLFVDLMKTLPQLRAYLPCLPRAYAISSSFRVGVFDCLYVALAEQEKCDFVTADDRVVKNLQPHFPSIMHLSSLP
jgi:predicted nucleic acid-binding protein